MESLRVLAAYNNIRLKNFFKSQRPLVIVSFIFLSLYGVFGGIKDACVYLGYNIAPYSYPHLMATPYMTLLICLGVILLFLDAPFLDSISQALISKMGRGLWFLANVVYIGIMSLAYSLSYHIGLLVGMIGYQTFIGDWGKVITSLARLPSLMSELGLRITYSADIISKYSPASAMVHSSLISILEFMIIGLIIYVVALHFKSNWQGLLAGVLYIMMNQIVYLNIPGYLDGLFPINFLNIGVFEEGTYIWSHSLGQGYLILLLFIGVLILIGLRRVKRMDIIIYKEESQW